jgi:hypothetical protein
LFSGTLSTQPRLESLTTDFTDNTDWEGGIDIHSSIRVIREIRGPYSPDNKEDISSSAAFRVLCTAIWKIRAGVRGFFDHG